MTQQRFETLAEAYGADVSRWPAEEREAAAAFMAREPVLARDALAGADALDAVLGQWSPAAPSHGLREQVVAGAPRARRSGGLRSWFLGAGLGAGLAAAGAAGLAVGVALSFSAAPDGSETLNAAMNGYDGISISEIAAEGA